jgi:hypothetical protein
MYGKPGSAVPCGGGSKAGVPEASGDPPRPGSALHGRARARLRALIARDQEMADGRGLGGRGHRPWGNCGEFALRPGWWHAILGLARQHGWDPQATQPPSEWEGEGDPIAWDGRYWPGMGQQVTGADARNLGRALARAVADIPDHAGTPYWHRPDPDIRPVTDVTTLELLSGAESKEVLGWFLEHCDGCCGGGGFSIVDDDYLGHLARLLSHDNYRDAGLPTAERGPLMAVPSPLRPVAGVSLDALAQDPAKAASLPAEVRRAVTLRCVALIGACAAGGPEPEGVTPAQAATEAANDWLTADEVACLLKKPRKWLIRHHRELPFARKVSRKTILFSRASGLRWVETRPR